MTSNLAEDNVEEFDSSDEESKTEKMEKKSAETSANEEKQQADCVPNKNSSLSERVNEKQDSSSLKRQRESKPTLDHIPLKRTNIPSVDRGSLEVTLVYDPENVEENPSPEDNKTSDSEHKDIQETKDEEAENVEEDAYEDREDKFGLNRESVTHQQLMELTSSSVASLIESDPLLSDLPSDVTLEEINSQIALVQGQSISVMLAASQPAKLVVAQEGTVLDLKRSLQRHTALRLARQGRSKVKVNWRYFWRTHWLVQSGGNRLTRDSDKLAELGIGNKSVLTYCKRLNERQR